MSIQNTDQKPSFPEIGELVIGEIAKVTQVGGEVTVYEYSDWKGFVHISDVTLGYVRNVRKFLRKGQKKVMMIKRINSKRKEIDLSLKHVSKEQQKQKLSEQKKFDKAERLLKTISEKGKWTQSQTNIVEDQLLSKFHSLHEAFSEVIEDGTSVLKDLGLSSKQISVIEDTTKHISKPRVEILGTLNLSTDKSNGVEIIKEILLDTINQYKKNINITYLGAPNYQLKVNASEFKKAEGVLEEVLGGIKKRITKNKGVFGFTRKKSKKYEGF